MSLHDKVIAWFVCFASLTVILFVLGDYYQSTRALRVALDSRATAVGTEAAADIDSRYDRQELAVMRFGYDVMSEPDREHELPAGFSAVRVFRNDSLIWNNDAAPSPAGGECAFGVIHFETRFSDSRHQAYRAEAFMSSAVFFAGVEALSARLGRTGVTSVLETERGSLLYDAGCVIRSSLTPNWLRREIATQARAPMPERGRTRVTTVRPGERDHEYLMAIVRVQDPSWSVVVALDYSKWAAPFVAARTQYLAFMIGVMLVALLIMLHVIRHDMLRLAAISRAADAIGHGRFDVWLPPPTSDEVGRLSLALGGMVNRLATTMHKMELSAAMAAVGELATYLSHEIRNPLSSIRLNLQMLKRDLRSGAVPDDGPQLVGLCLTELQRLDDVVKTVLEVGRRGPDTRVGECDVHEVVLETVHVMESKLAAHGVQLETRFGANEALVGIAAAQLKSVLINLLLNGVDALADAGTKSIVITTDLHELIEGEAYVELRVMDTGPGVPSHLRQRIFEPFFTTKTSGNGIGLATSLRVMTQCGGELHCLPTSEETGGAEFVLEVPLARTRIQGREPVALAVAS
jgi:signal transduction histidine kinase